MVTLTLDLSFVEKNRYYFTFLNNPVAYGIPDIPFQE